MSSRPWLIGTRLPEPLAADVHAAIERLRVGGPGASTVAFETILALTEASLRIHFREPIAALGVGLMTRKTLDVALDLAVRGLRGPMRAVLSGFDDAQLARVADLLEERLYPDPHG